MSGNQMVPLDDRNLSVVSTASSSRAPMALSDPSAMSFDDLLRAAEFLAKSKLFGGIDTPEKAVSLMLVCQAEGRHPMDAMKRYHIINGKATMRADAMLAEFQAQGGRVEWAERTDTRVSASFTHPAGGTVSIMWDMEQAKRAGLAGKDTWKNYPRQMLTARVISEGIRTILPGVVMGIYTPDETEEFTPAPAPAPTVTAEEPRRIAAPVGPAANPNVKPLTMVAAVNAFADEAERAGLDVMDREQGKPKKPKLLSVAGRVARFLGDTPPDRFEQIKIEDWSLYTQHLEACVRAESASQSTAQASLTTSDDDDDLEDPFVGSAPEEAKPKSAIESGL